VEVDRRDLANFNRAIVSLANMTGRSVDSVMKQAVPRLARSAARATKPGTKFPPNPKNRPKRDIRGRLLGARKRGEIPWWADYKLTVYKQGLRGSSQKKFLYVTEQKLHKYIRIPNRGAAKAAWFGAIPRELAGRTSGIAGGIRGARRYSKGRLMRDRGMVVGAKLTNLIRYNQKAGKDAPEIAVRKTTSWFDKAVEREEKKLERVWRSRLGRLI